MKFFAVNGKRPIRLCEETRKFAFDSLNHKYGLETWSTPTVSMDDYEEFENLTSLQKYDAAIERIAMTAPIRICDGEKLSGAATLGMAISHNIPATFGGKPVFSSSISHLTIDFDTVLKKGVNFIRCEAEKYLIKYAGTEKEGSRLAALFRICVYLCSASNFFRKSTSASTPSLGIAL